MQFIGYVSVHGFDTRVLVRTTKTCVYLKKRGEKGEKGHLLTEESKYLENNKIFYKKLEQGEVIAL